MDIKITVRRKLPICGDVAIVCNNSDYTVIWELDEEWDGYDAKTMRTVYKDGTYTDTVFTGDTVALPVVTVPGTVKIGLYAGDIRTSRAALIRALPSVTSDGGAPAKPSDDVYNQIMERMAQLETPDWAQNDESAKDYVRNRTHWKTPARKMILPECEVVADPSFEPISPEPLGEESDAEGDSNIGWADLAFTEDAAEFIWERIGNSVTQDTFVVRFDGIEYRVKLPDWHVYDKYRNEYIGNASIEGFGEDTGEPFFVDFGMEMLTAHAGTHTISIECLYDEVYPLAPEYTISSAPFPLVVRNLPDGSITPIYRAMFDCRSANSDSSEVIFDLEAMKFRLAVNPAADFGDVAASAPNGLNLSVGNSKVFYSENDNHIKAMQKLGKNRNIAVHLFISGKYGSEPYSCLATRAPRGSGGEACGGLCYHTDGKLYGMTAELNSAQTQVTVTIKRLM